MFELILDTTTQSGQVVSKISFCFQLFLESRERRKSESRERSCLARGNMVMQVAEFLHQPTWSRIDWNNISNEPNYTKRKHEKWAWSDTLKLQTNVNCTWVNLENVGPTFLVCYTSKLFVSILCWTFPSLICGCNMWKAEFGYQVRGMTQVVVCTTSQ